MPEILTAEQIRQVQDFADAGIYHKGTVRVRHLCDSHERLRAERDASQEREHSTRQRLHALVESIVGKSLLEDEVGEIIPALAGLCVRECDETLQICQTPCEMNPSKRETCDDLSRTTCDSHELLRAELAAKTAECAEHEKGWRGLAERLADSSLTESEIPDAIAAAENELYDLRNQCEHLRAERDELLEALVNLVAATSHVEKITGFVVVTGNVDIQIVRRLVSLGRFEIVHDSDCRVIGRWKEKDNG